MFDFSLIFGFRLGARLINTNIAWPLEAEGLTGSWDNNELL
jgi:hypothetical protein